MPIVGRWALGPLGSPIPVMARLPLWTCAGIAIWSVPLLGSAALGVYRPEWMGALGWVTVAAFLVTSRFSVRLPRLGRWDVVALIGILAGAALAARYAADPFTTGRDMSVYAQHALYIVHHGRLDVPYPAPGAELMPPGFRGGREMVGGRLVRWTNGHARFAIPVEGPVAPRRLSFEIGGSGPQGTNVRLVLNGLTLFDGRVPPGSWAADFPVAGLQDGEVAEIEIISGTFVPAESSGSPDQRELGVMIQGITLSPGEE